MTQTIRPMLAAQKYREAGDLWGELHQKVVQKHLDEDGFLIGQPKWDGMRAILWDGVARSRSWTPLGNQALQQFAAAWKHKLHGIDGEVFTGHKYAPDTFRESMSGVRAGSGSGDLTIVYFDCILSPNADYYSRMNEATGIIGDMVKRFEGDGYNVVLTPCPSVELRSIEEIFAYEEDCKANNFEGAIIRRKNAPYKYNRSTALGGNLVKVKRRLESHDAIVVGYEEGYTNTNEKTTSALGFAKRSSHKENLVPNGRLGALDIKWVNGPFEGVEQKVGVFRGLSHSDLEKLWLDRESLPGQYIECSMDPATGGYGAARCPVFLRFRDKEEF